MSHAATHATLQDFPVSVVNNRQILGNMHVNERRDLMMGPRNMRPIQNPGPSVMDDIRRMSVPPGANMFARPPPGMPHMRPPAHSMMGPPMGPSMGPRAPFPIPPKMESPMPMAPPFPQVCVHVLLARDEKDSSVGNSVRSPNHRFLKPRWIPWRHTLR